MKRLSFMATGIALAAMSPLCAFASCGSAFCPINTQWALQGAWQQPGIRLDLRQEYIYQDQPRHGTEAVGVGELPDDHDEVSTRNNNTLATFDYTASPQWGVSVTVPYIQREHIHIHNDPGGAEEEKWDIDGLGDVRVQGRFRPAQRNVSLLFGAKLPTGSTDEVNADGEEAERPLQPGTGTTDLLLGASWQKRHLQSAWSWFAQGLWQRALAADHGFEPGQKLLLDLGTRYSPGKTFSLMAQLNGVIKDRDSGAEAEPADSGSEMLYLSPGASLAVGKQLQLYAFVQQPLYQRVNGVQLTADRAYTAGISVRF